VGTLGREITGESIWAVPNPDYRKNCINCVHRRTGSSSGPGELRYGFPSLDNHHDHVGGITRNSTPASQGDACESASSPRKDYQTHY
jgi:hypothetical protein